MGRERKPRATRRRPDEPAVRGVRADQVISVHISRATFAEILWVYLQAERAARRLPFVIARAESCDFTALLEGAFSDGRFGVRNPIEGLYLSVTCSEETLRVAASDIGPDTGVPEIGPSRSSAEGVPRVATVEAAR